MIKEIHLQNWKSFEKSTLYIDPLTFIIGTNDSGKSNILDALYFLYGSAKGIPLNDLAQKTRGGLDWLIRKGTDSFTLAAVIDDESGDLVYTLTCRKNELPCSSFQKAWSRLRHAPARPCSLQTPPMKIPPPLPFRFYSPASRSLWT